MRDNRDYTVRKVLQRAHDRTHAAEKGWKMQKKVGR